MSIEIVQGTQATIHFDAKKCIHSRNCVLSHPDVFVPNVKGEWIHPDAQPLAELVRIGQSCPSGAIQVFKNDYDEPIDSTVSSDCVPLVNTVRVRENGPLAIEAELQIGGERMAAPRSTRWRGGHSANKPYCDGAHVAAGFVASGEPATEPFEPLKIRNGVVNVQALPSGPLQVSGNLEVVSGTGRTCNKVETTYLCRCGESKNKPYCDGSHKAAGFEAP